MKPFVHVATMLSLILSSLAIAGCSKEKDDFIAGPTETSAIVTGRVMSHDGSPLADVPVGVDYHEGQFLAFVKTIHKAKGQTDANGNFRMFFEPEKEKNNQGIFTYYNIFADLSRVSRDKYILPSDLDSPFIMDSDVVSVSISSFKQGESASGDFIIPRKKSLTILLEDYTSGDALTVTNTIEYCDHFVTISSPVTFSSANTASATIICAIDETNNLAVVRDRDSETLDSQELQVTSSTDGPVTFKSHSIQIP